METAEKIFTVDIILNCGREIYFFIKQSKVSELAEGIASRADSVTISDDEDHTIVLAPKEVAILIVKEYIKEGGQTHAATSTRQ